MATISTKDSPPSHEKPPIYSSSHKNVSQLTDIVYSVEFVPTEKSHLSKIPVCLSFTVSSKVHVGLTVSSIFIFDPVIQIMITVLGIFTQNPCSKRGQFWNFTECSLLSVGPHQG